MRSFVLVVGGLRLHGLRWDDLGRGRPALLLHGLASNARIWERVAPALAEAGIAPVALDLRGHGLTDKPETGYDMATVASDLCAAVRDLGLQAPILIGHSWGAGLALHLAASGLGEGNTPSAIVLVDGGISQLDDLPGATWERVSEVLAPPPLAGMRREDLLLRLSDPGRRWQPDPQSLDITLANFEVLPDDTVQPRLRRDHHMQLLRALYDSRTYEAFERVRCPTLVISARPPEPRRLEEEAHLLLKARGIERARESIADLQAVWMEDTVHDIPLHRPDELAETIVSFAVERGLNRPPAPRRDESRRDMIPIEGDQGPRRGRETASADEDQPGGVLRLRQARAADARAVRDLVRRVRINPTGLDWRRFLVAEGPDGTILACGQIKPHGDGTRELASVAVAEDWRGRGMAREIVQRLQRQAGPPLWLTCREGLEPMYARFGFRRVHDRRAMTPYFRRLDRLARLVLGLLRPGEGLAIMVWQESCNAHGVKTAQP
jgi:pimeloyl-ACP methyl ester carboxylesterase/GNAT superfamily N-acetyltransferase